MATTTGRYQICSSGILVSAIHGGSPNVCVICQWISEEFDAMPDASSRIHAAGTCPLEPAELRD